MENNSAVEPQQIIKQLYTWSTASCCKDVPLTKNSSDMCNSCIINEECETLLGVVTTLRDRGIEVD